MMTLEDGQGGGTTARGLGPLFSGLFAAILIALTLLVAVVLGMGEQEMIARAEPTATDTLTPTVTSAPPSPTLTPVPSKVVPSPTSSPISTPAIAATETLTPRPTLAATQTRPPTRTSVPTRCIENPWGWDDVWVVRPGETLFSIASDTDSTVQELIRANCLTSTVIYPTQELWVRHLPPTPTRVPTRTPTDTPTGTPSPTPSDTPTASDTPTPSDTPTASDTPTPSHTPTASDTPTPSPTPSHTPTASDTPAPTPTYTPKPTNTPTTPEAG